MALKLTGDQIRALCVILLGAGLIILGFFVPKVAFFVMLPGAVMILLGVIKLIIGRSAEVTDQKQSDEKDNGEA